MNSGYIIRGDGAVVCTCHNRVVAYIGAGYMELWCKGSRHGEPHSVRIRADAGINRETRTASTRHPVRGTAAEQAL